MVTIFRALGECTSLLKDSEIESPRLDAEVILAHLLGCSRLALLTDRDKVLDDEMYARFKELINLRIKGMPVAYLTGSREFMGLVFEVRQGVLIPRGDTEIVVEKAVMECARHEGIVRVADVGCGSGAIGISIAKYAPNADVTLIDISEEAVSITSCNADKNGVGGSVKIIRGDLLLPVLDQRFDIIVSNPPYIETSVIPTLQRAVREYEPLTALDGGIDGLKFYREITAQAYNCLRHGGLIVYEIGYNQALSVKNILMENNFKNVEVFKDLAGLDRCVTGRI